MKIFDPLGCEEFETNIELTSLENECLFIPTLFTPNGGFETSGGLNDTWHIGDRQKTIGGPTIDDFYPNATIKIYNRWGQLIFEHKEGNYSENEWDGTFEGENLPMGTYYFLINCNDENNKTYHGGIVLKR